MLHCVNVIISSQLGNYTYLVRGIRKAAGGEEQVGFVFVPGLRLLFEAAVGRLRVGSAHHLSHVGFDRQFPGPDIFTTLTKNVEEERQGQRKRHNEEH